MYSFWSLDGKTKLAITQKEKHTRNMSIIAGY